MFEQLRQDFYNFFFFIGNAVIFGKLREILSQPIIGTKTSTFYVNGWSFLHLLMGFLIIVFLNIFWPHLPLLPALVILFIIHTIHEILQILVKITDLTFWRYQMDIIVDTIMALIGGLISWMILNINYI